MEKGSAAAGLDLNATRGNSNGERINDSHPRKPGNRPGTFTVSCMICEGEGYVRARGYGSGHETCLTCGGEGTVERDGEREGDSDRRTQPTWGDVFWFSMFTMVITALGCWLLIWRARGH